MFTLSSHAIGKGIWGEFEKEQGSISTIVTI
jgi:hypothetical protein